MCGYIGNYTDLSYSEIIKILDKAPYGSLGSYNYNGMEVVPMYYVLEEFKNELYIYFILINENQSFINMSSNKDMTFLVTYIIEQCESNFYSIVAKGKFDLVQNPKYINWIKKLFKDKYESKSGCPLKSFEGNCMNYVRMNITEITGRKYTKKN